MSDEFFPPPRRFAPRDPRTLGQRIVLYVALVITLPFFGAILGLGIGEAQCPSDGDDCVELAIGTMAGVAVALVALIVGIVANEVRIRRAYRDSR